VIILKLSEREKMAVESNALTLGTKAPGFNLTDTITGEKININDIKSKIATVVMFLCNHCPYVKLIQTELVKLVKEYQAKGISFAGISSNDISAYPEDSPEKMKDVAKEFGFTFPYLYDESQDTARSYQAACTPEFFVFDKNLSLVYHGQFDNSRPSLNIPVTGDDLRNALDNLISGKPVEEKQIPSIGCSIKWKQNM
jgi:peroxiredoxin